ncbi:hypothetical protein [Burkholderia sp. SIMBA_062]|uniref:hypothetical protein n=1 Tax=Burkholderia sp. SIMBA_062 TaxID=3085803 RepID=UPI003977EC9E
MTWLTHHRQSESAALSAHELLRSGDVESARRAFLDAAELELLALSELEFSKIKTRSITAVSAAALLYKADQFERACQLAYSQLGAGGLEEFARYQLEEIVQAVYTERERQKYDVSFLPGVVNVAVRGGDVLRGAAPLDLVVDRVKAIQAMFYRVIEWNTGRPHRKGPPTKDVTSLFEPWLLQEVPGSFQFSVAIKTNTQLELFEKENPGAADIARKFLNVVHTISTDESGRETSALVPEEEYRNTFRKLVRNLAPSGKDFESLEFHSEGIAEMPRIDSNARSKIGRVIKAELPRPEVDEQPVELAGSLRAVDLNEDWLKIHVPDAGDQKVTGVSQQVDDVIGPMVNRQVLVHAVKTKSGGLRFVDIELSAVDR